MSAGDPRLPWHYASGGHIYVWAGGQLMRRMTPLEYRSLIRGRPTESEWLDLNGSTNLTFDEFSDMCDDYERRNNRFEFKLPQNLLHG